MPRGIPVSGQRMANPNPGNPYKCETCGSTVKYKCRLEHERSHLATINCAVESCELKHQNTPSKMRRHYEHYHETQCVLLG